jgi:hypothetical protein
MRTLGKPRRLLVTQGSGKVRERKRDKKENKTGGRAGYTSMPPNIFIL